MKLGTKGESIRLLQQFLICYMGYYYVPFNAYFDPETEQAVREFQDYYNYLGKSNPNYLNVDGEVGEQTWRAIGNVFC